MRGSGKFPLRGFFKAKIYGMIKGAIRKAIHFKTVGRILTYYLWHFSYFICIMPLQVRCNYSILQVNNQSINDWSMLLVNVQGYKSYFAYLPQEFWHMNAYEGVGFMCIAFTPLS